MGLRIDERSSPSCSQHAGHRQPAVAIRHGQPHADDHPTGEGGHSCLPAGTHNCVQVHKQTHAHACTPIQTHAHKNARKHTHTHTHSHTHVFMYALRQNLVLALGAVVAATLPTMAGVIPLWIAVALHEGSTVLVALNSLRCGG